MQPKTFFIPAVLPCLLLFALSLENEEGEGRAVTVYQTVEETELNPNIKEAGLNPKAKEAGPNPKAKEVGPNPKAKEAGPNLKAKEVGPNPKAKEAGPNLKAKEVGPNPKAKEAGPNLKAKEVGPNLKAKEAGLKPKAKEVVVNPNTKEAGPNPHTKEVGHKPKATESKVRARGRKGPESRGDQAGRKLRDDATCAGAGRICQRSTYLCQGRYLPDRCAGPRARQCCVSGAWGALCSGHHRNRVRGCDAFGCGTFGSKRGGRIHKAVDVVCDDYSVIRAPFQGTLRGPAQRQGKGGIQYDGVKLSNSEFCVRIFNVWPYRYRGGVSRGEPLGYLLPLQERLSGITSHLQVQMCDRSDPSPFI